MNIHETTIAADTPVPAKRHADRQGRAVRLAQSSIADGGRDAHSTGTAAATYAAGEDAKGIVAMGFDDGVALHSDDTSECSDAAVATE